MIENTNTETEGTGGPSELSAGLERILNLARHAFMSRRPAEAWFKDAAPNFAEFARLIAAEEREACAKVCETFQLTIETHKYPSPEERHLLAVASAGCRGAFTDAIRMRSNAEWSGARK